MSESVQEANKEEKKANKLIIIGLIITSVGMVLSWALTCYLAFVKIPNDLEINTQKISQEAAQKAKEDFVKALSTNIARINAEMPLEDALKAINQINNDYEKLSEAAARWESETKKTELVKRVDEYIKSQNYPSAISALQASTFSDDEEIKLFLNKTISDYEAYSMSEANKLANAGKSSEALAVLYDALTTISSSKALIDRKNEIEGSKPLYVGKDIHADALGAYMQEASNIAMNIAGKQFMYGLQLNKHGYHNVDETSIFYLDGKYSKLLGSFGHIDGSARAPITLGFILDNGKPIEFSMNWDDSLKPIEINVSGVKQLKIAYKVDAAEYGLGDLRLLK